MNLRVETKEFEGNSGVKEDSKWFGMKNYMKEGDIYQHREY
jgi:hypothetical protein